MGQHAKIFYIQRNVQIRQMIEGLGTGFDVAILGLDLNDVPLSNSTVFFKLSFLQYSVPLASTGWVRSTIEL